MDRAIVRVTHVVFDLEGGGMESLVGAMAVALRDTDIRMSVLTLSGRIGRIGRQIKSEVEALRTVQSLRLVSIVRPTAIAGALRELAPDVVHLHSGCWYKCSLAARMAGIRRIIYTEHGREHHDTRLARWLDRRASQRTDAVITVSDRLAAYMVDTVGIDASKIHTITNGVDTSRFGPSKLRSGLREQLGIPSTALIVGSVGRLEVVKAYHRLIDAVAVVQTSIKTPIWLVFCGDGSELGALRDRAAAAGIEDRTRFVGWIDDPINYLQMFDVFALPSISEGLSVSLLEAMACGAVPVVTDVGANRDVLGPPLRGQLAPSPAGQEFTNVLKRTLGDPATLTALARQAEIRVKEHYELGRMVDAYQRLYGV